MYYIREVFLADFKRVFEEIDFAGSEVSPSACSLRGVRAATPLPAK